MTKIWSKVAAFFAAIAGIFLIAIKVLSGKNKKLEREIKLKDRQNEIRREQDATIDKILRDEEKRIENSKKPDNRSRADRINSVLNDRNNP